MCSEIPGRVWESKESGKTGEKRKIPRLKKKSCGFKVYKRKEHEHDGKRRIGGTLVKKKTGKTGLTA